MSSWLFKRYNSNFIIIQGKKLVVVYVYLITFFWQTKTTNSTYRFFLFQMDLHFARKKYVNIYIGENHRLDAQRFETFCILYLKCTFGSFCSSNQLVWTKAHREHWSKSTKDKRKKPFRNKHTHRNGYSIHTSNKHLRQ